MTVAEVAPITPRLSVLSSDDGLVRLITTMARDLDLEVGGGAAECPTLIDPMVGVQAVADHFARHPLPPVTAVVRRPSCPGASLLALRLSGGGLVEDPRIQPGDLRTFLSETFAVAPPRPERRGYPRSGPSGVQVLSPEGAQLLDLAPYGARIRMPGEVGDLLVLSLEVLLQRTGARDQIACQVAETRSLGDATEVRLRFVRLGNETQHELFKIAKAHILSSTLRDTVERLERMDVDGFRWLTSRDALVRILGNLASNQVELTFARVYRGRVVQGVATELDEGSRQLRVTVPSETALGPPGAYLCFAATWKHESFLFDGYVLGYDETSAILSQPTRCVLTDQRAQDRLVLGLDSPLRIRIGECWFPVTDLSPRGFAFYVETAADVLPESGQLDVEFQLGDGSTRTELAMLRYRRPEASGFTAGATFVDGAEPLTRRAFVPLVEEVATFKDLDLVPAVMTRPYHASSVQFASGARNVAGLWNEVEHEGPRTVFIVPPAWGKTKESVSILAQFLCAMFDANQRHVAVLRIDYVNALGESDKEAAFRQPGMEALGLELSECVANVRAAIDFAHRRLDAPAAATVLIGMSFSGPLCLRAAVDDDRVTHLVELMGASDLQDLIRTASGGIDYVANFRAGVRDQVRNILGVLSDADRWCADGFKAGLLQIQDSQRDATRLRVPVLWVHGRFDAFVNEMRVRSILASAFNVERRLTIVPCGHVPTKSHEALLAYLPVARFALKSVGVEEPTAAMPNERVAGTVAAAEWARAPRTELVSPREYWRSYMLGTTELGLGFDVLAMTREYQLMMQRQLELLDLSSGSVMVDLGCGLGHSLKALASLEGVTGVRALLFDLVPQLLDEARDRAKGAASIETFEWDAEVDGPPARLHEADGVLMSLFLSCVADPLGFLRTLAEGLETGTRVVASSFRPDSDLSQIYVSLLHDIRKGAIRPPPGYDHERFLQAVREYMNSAAFLLRLFDEGRFRFFEPDEFAELFTSAGLVVRTVERTFGTPPRAVVVRAFKP